MSSPAVPRRRGRRPAGADPLPARPPYELAWPLDGRSWTARQNLADIFERELLGPAGGPEEVLEGVPDAAYLVGRIAPVRLVDGTTDPTAEGDAAAPTDLGDAGDARRGRGVPLTAVDENATSAEEDAVDAGGEDVPQQRGLMIPASMGLRFQVPADLPSVTVHASWGVYEPVKGEDERRRPHRRTPVEKSIHIDLAGLQPGQTKPYPLVDDVKLRVDAYREVGPGGDRLLVDVALCNDRETPRAIPTNMWLYQTRLDVEAGGQQVFLPVNDPLHDSGRREQDAEVRRLNLQYRDRLEYAVGRTCSAGWGGDDVTTRRASRVWTTWLPIVETPQTTAHEIDEAVLDMRVLAAATTAELDAGLRPVVDGYTAWLDEQRQRAEDLPAHLRDEARDLVDEAAQVRDRLSSGLTHLLHDDEALRCFRFMNAVMADQRVQSQVAAARAADARLSIAAAEALVKKEGPKAHSWRTFQLAFVLLQLPLLSDPAAEERSGELATAQLLFFPTGGGKTEAYLGLAAYAFAVRRRQGLVGTGEDAVDGRAGVTVLMRYTLRLLTSQQFQRATALVCAAEIRRRADEETWGSEPFRIGLWVGTDVSPKRYEEAAEQLRRINEGRSFRLTALQVQRCPWCGTPITPGDVQGDDTARRLYVRCGDELGDCPFSPGGAVEDGLPMLTVDEEIYRLAPAFVIATVDKFARLAREGEAASLFGRVGQRCGRHGFVHPDYQHCGLTLNGKHQSKGGHPSAGLRPVQRLRPPDLVIQDELHLITGALGTSVGLFEVAVDVASSWSVPDGRPVRPLVVASSATVRNAPDQVRALFGRDVAIFPPQVLDAGNTYFSREEPITEETPGRRYVGVSTTGVRLTTAEIRIAEVLLAGGQLLLDRGGVPAEGTTAADPYLTLVGYFGATRELAGMKRYLGDDVETALRKTRPWSLLPRRTGTGFGHLDVGELTSRASSSDIGKTLDRMGVPFDARIDSADARRAAAADGGASTRKAPPFDVVLATSMLQVGVDVTRLGLMLMVGQPKNTAEYIQASSRVGRDPGRPGLVVSLGNWARPRDLAHFEHFRHYHETFYAQVEALSVTPFSLTSMERGLDGVLVSAARVSQAHRAGGLSPEGHAGHVGDERQALDALVDALVARVARAGDETARDTARDRLSNAVDTWVKRRDHLDARSQGLVYERAAKDKSTAALLRSPENAKAYTGLHDAPPFVVANSMREVQPEVNVLVSPLPDRLFVQPPPGAPQWVMPEGQEDA